MKLVNKHRVKLEQSFLLSILILIVVFMSCKELENRYNKIIPDFCVYEIESEIQKGIDINTAKKVI